MVNFMLCLFYHHKNIFQTVFTVDAPLSSWVQSVPAGCSETHSSASTMRSKPPLVRPSPPPPRSRCPLAACPKRCDRTHLGTEGASLVVVAVVAASFPKTSSMMCSSGATGTGSSGGTSVMISATCSVQKERDSHITAGQGQNTASQDGTPKGHSRDRFTRLTRKERKTSNILEPTYLSVYIENQNDIHNSTLGYKL